MAPECIFVSKVSGDNIELAEVLKCPHPDVKIAFTAFISRSVECDRNVRLHLT